MRSITLSAFIVFLPCFVMADGHSDALARLETYTEKMTDNLMDFYVARVPELGDVRPDMTWDTEMREAGQCILDGITADGGDAGVATYLAALEDFADADIVKFTDLTTKMPDALATDVVLTLSSSCGMVKIGSERMAASGLNEAFAKEGVMARVLAPAE
jgi:hypothetical protein